MNYYLKKIINSYFKLFVPIRNSEKNIQKIHTTFLESKNKKILFICTGNICRSAFSQHEFKHSDKKLTIASCGIYTTPGKTADQDAIKYAKNFNVDLSLHKTSIINCSDLESASINLVMEPWQLIYLKFKYPNTRKNTFLISNFIRHELTSWEIEDPFNKNKETFIKVFNHLKKCNEKIKDMILTRIIHEPRD